jgi:hypothetical protein
MIYGIAARVLRPATLDRKLHIPNAAPCNSRFQRTRAMEEASELCKIQFPSV